VVLMLVSEAALDAVLQRGTDGFAGLVRDHLVVSTASNSPGCSRALAVDVEAAGGRYVEAPVSGSRRPAEAGVLVALLGGDPDDVAAVRPLLAPTCRAQLVCGGVGSGLMMKLAVNVYLDPTMAGLAEAVHFSSGTSSASRPPGSRRPCSTPRARSTARAWTSATRATT